MARFVWLAVLGIGGMAICTILIVPGFFHSDRNGPVQGVDAPGAKAGVHHTPPGDGAGRRDADPGAPTSVRDWTTLRARIRGKKKGLLRDGPLPYDQPQAAMDFFLSQRLPAGQNLLPLGKLRAARAEIARRAPSQGNTAGRTVGEWTELGPPNIGGRTRAIVINPTNPSIMFAAGVAGGVWKSVDAGASWAPTDDFMANLAVSSLAMDPADPSILYAGTGEGFFNSDAVRGLGIFKTTDAGATWAQLEGTVTGVPFGSFFRVNEIVISPADHLRVYAATRYGVWKSADGGATWSVVLGNPSHLDNPLPASNGSSAGCLDIAIRTDTAPGADTVLAAFGNFERDGLFRSTDSGITWTQVGTAVDLDLSNQGRMEIAFAPSNNNIVYVSMADNGFGAPEGTVVDIFRSDDGGLTWAPRLNLNDNVNNPLLLSNLVFGNGCFGFDAWGQGWYDNVIKVDPVDPEIVWVGGIDLFRSDDGGVNFGLASYWYFSPGDPKYVHADQHALVFHPDYDGVTNQTLYSGSDGGLARTDNARAATTPLGCPFAGDPLPDIDWVGLNNGYGVTQFYHGDSAADADIYGGGTQDNGTNLVHFVPPATDWSEILGGDGGYFAIDPTNDLVMYAETQWFPSIQKSVDGGLSFAFAGDGITDWDGLFITPFVLDQSNPQVLWSGGSRPWRTTSGAEFWELAGPELFWWVISAIAVAPSDSEVVYLGAASGEVARTTDGLNTQAQPTWGVFDFNNGLDFGFVSSIAVHPTDPDTAYCTYSNFGLPHVFRTVDGGITWTPIDSMNEPNGIPDIPAHWIAVRPCNPDELFVGTELGVFESADGGVTWSPANTGLANTVVETLDFQNDYTLVAFTHGRGAFRTLLTCPCDPSAPLVDCNTNANPDECDIFSGTSDDCNDNEIPDDCELDGNDCNANGIPDDCEQDCQPNGVPDACDLDVTDPDGNGAVSSDCNANGIPDECERDCNENGVPDDCDIDGTDPDGNGASSDDCDGNGFPDECDALGGGTLWGVDFESGLPAGWATTGIFSVTGACGVVPTCDGAKWAYAGNTFQCAYFDQQAGELISPPVTLGPTYSELRFCSMLDTETGYDFADVLVNGQRVFRGSGHIGAWTNHVVDLSAFAGQSITITFRLASDENVSGTRGWQVDNILLVSGSPAEQPCCRGGNACVTRLPQCCLDEGGSLQGAGHECTSPQACCMPDAACEMLDPLCCLEDGGVPAGAGTSCSQPEACCLADGTCEALDPLCCVQRGGVSQGPQSACTAPQGCCLPDGTCDMLDPLCCLESNGTPLGLENDCTEPEGCCMPDDTCERFDPLCCAELGGVPQGPGTACTLSQACCMPDGTCQALDPLCCAEAGGNPNGAGTTCTQPGACCLPNGTCQLLDPLCCRDKNGVARGSGTVCTDHICECNTNADCDNGSFCDGSETCNLILGCQAGGNVCTDPLKPQCDEASDTCVPCLVDAHCDDGVSCTTDTCDLDSHRCSNRASDAACDDGDFCNGVETCDASTGCLSGTAQDCDDEVDCTVDRCDSALAACRHDPDHDSCDDDLFCTGAEVCDANAGCLAGSPPDCDDDIDNNLDLCNERSNSCRHGELFVSGEPSIVVGATAIYTSRIVYDDGAEEEVSHRVTWRVVSTALTGVESRACAMGSDGTLRCRRDLYGENPPSDDAIVEILVEARMAEGASALVAATLVSVLPLEDAAPKPDPTGTESTRRSPCGAFGLLGPVLPLFGLCLVRGRKRRSPCRSS